LGHSLRKSFPLVGFVEMVYDDIFQIVVADPLELTQALRFFKFLNP
jgi:NADH:ubiquinone oxidoreductase subunit C